MTVVMDTTMPFTQEATWRAGRTRKQVHILGHLIRVSLPWTMYHRAIVGRGEHGREHGSIDHEEHPVGNFDRRNSSQFAFPP